jgi:hypothetical protein
VARPTDRNTFKRKAERIFPHRVDIPVPGTGLGHRLTDMLDWCRTHLLADAWAEHGHSEKRKGEAALFFARFYFANGAVVVTFRKVWAADPRLQRIQAQSPSDGEAVQRVRNRAYIPGHANVA